VNEEEEFNSFAKAQAMDPAGDIKVTRDKLYRTRDGREVRIYAVDGNLNYPVHGATKNAGGWTASCWRANGRISGNPESSMDLIEVKPRIRRTVWLVFWPKNGDRNISSVKLYDNFSDANYAFQKVEWFASKAIGMVELTSEFSEGSSVVIEHVSS
jgi:hypothetical protein